MEKLACSCAGAGPFSVDKKSVRDAVNECREEYEGICSAIDMGGEGEVSALFRSPDSLGSEAKCDLYHLVTDKLKAFGDNLERSLNKVSTGFFTHLLQVVGRNVRRSGRADDDEVNSEEVLGFSKRLNLIIKSVRSVCKKSGDPCYIVIDAIRNPYEAQFLKERYAAFFLVSINTSNANRLEHLASSHKLSPGQIAKLDNTEYPDNLKGYARFSNQNIQKCIEISDIHINNPNLKEQGKGELASQLAWYVSLMMHPGLVTPSAVESCMQVAYSVKNNSGCISRQVGAVVTDSDHSVMAVGWNNTPQGQVPCLLRSAGNALSGVDSEAYSDYEKNDSDFHRVLRQKFNDDVFGKAQDRGRNVSFCFKDVQNEVEGKKNQVHTRSLHAEENAFLQISKHGGQPINGGYLFTTASPCELCSKKAYQIGIKKVYYIDPYPGIASEHVLASGSKRPKMILFRGAVGRAFHRLYQPFMPYKDELAMLAGVVSTEVDWKKKFYEKSAELDQCQKSLQSSGSAGSDGCSGCG